MSIGRIDELGDLIEMQRTHFTYFKAYCIIIQLDLWVNR